jgi:transcriptional regulator with XRE-family HTH domain
MNKRDTALTEVKMALIAARERGEPDALTHALRQAGAENADAIVEFDLGLVATSSYGNEADAPDVMEIAQRARVRAFAAAFSAKPTAAAVSLKSLIKAQGSSLVALASRIGLGVDVLSALEMGRISLKSVPQRLYDALSEALDATVEQITAAVAYDVAPALRRGQPGARAATNKQIDFAEAVISSQSMTPEQRASWLAESAGR